MERLWGTRVINHSAEKEERDSSVSLFSPGTPLYPGYVFCAISHVLLAAELQHSGILSALAFSGAIGSKVAPGPLPATCCRAATLLKNKKKGLFSSYVLSEKSLFCVLLCVKIHTCMCV